MEPSGGGKKPLTHVPLSRENPFYGPITPESIEFAEYLTSGFLAGGISGMLVALIKNKDFTIDQAVKFARMKFTQTLTFHIVGFGLAGSIIFGFYHFSNLMFESSEKKQEVWKTSAASGLFSGMAASLLLLMSKRGVPRFPMVVIPCTLGVWCGSIHGLLVQTRLKNRALQQQANSESSEIPLNLESSK